MTWQIDRSLHWTDHYIEYGFAKIDRAVGPEFTEPAMAEVRRVLGHENRPLNEWTNQNTPTRSPVAPTSSRASSSTAAEISSMQATMPYGSGWSIPSTPGSPSAWRT